LYRELDEATRLRYSQFLHALIMRDDVQASTASLALGVTDWDKFALSVLMRPYKNTHAGLSDLILRSDVVELQRLALHNSRFREEWIAFLKTMPRPLLLTLRNQAYVRALCEELGNPINRFRVMVRSAVRGAHLAPLNSSSRSFSWMSLAWAYRWWDKFVLEINLLASDITMAAGTAYLRFFHREKYQWLQAQIAEQDRVLML
jgi:hypothetical protein